MELVEQQLTDMLRSAGLPVTEIPPNRHYWYIRTNSGDYYQEYVQHDFIALGHEDVPCVPPDDRTKELIAAVTENNPQSTRVLNQVYKFCKKMKKNDIVIIPAESSSMFSFGICDDDEIFEVPDISDDEKVKGKCPYKRRRRITWIKNIPKGRVDSKLYTFFRNQQALSLVDEYDVFIERAINPLYIKNGIAHFTLTMEPVDSPDALDIPIYIQGILTRVKYLEQKFDTVLEKSKIRSRTNVQCAGLVELFGNPASILLISAIAIFLFGGRASFKQNAAGNYEGEIGTPGLLGAITTIWDKFHESKRLQAFSKDEVLAAQNRLKVKDPRDIPDVKPVQSRKKRKRKPKK